MSSDLGLDPSDPLNLLLNNSADSSMEDSSSTGEGASPPDWSQLSALWPDSDQIMGGNMKSYNDIMEFSDLASLPMDMDYNPSMSIEPSVLHFDPTKLTYPSLQYSYGEQPSYEDLLSSQFPFTFQSPSSGFSSSSPSISSASPQLSAKERRLSVTSSSSSSGQSFSPCPESAASSATGYHCDVAQQAKDEPSVTSDTATSYMNDPAAELAQRVRQTAGVMLAVPMGAQLQGHGANQQVALPITNAPQAKLPIPRLPRHNSQPTSKASSPSASSSVASTPPPSTPPPPSSAAPSPPQLIIESPTPPDSDASALPTPTSTSISSASAPRPKTSHTTIERRYRTNLNARIQSLRMAVPALRVLEDREGSGKKIKKNVKGGVPVKGTVDAEDGEVDVIDERGFVDGVKVARKCSKANVLGKAVEYIRVLKKREIRLKAEQSGLKMLVSGLVGGPALLREWEREWHERFGGEEKDEVEGEPDVEGDDEDSEDGEDGEEEEAGRKRKRGKVAPVRKDEKEKKEKKPVVHTPTQPGEPGAVPEKRKRGRPRKVPAPMPVTPVIQQQQPQEPVQIQMQVDQAMYPPPITAEAWVQQMQQQQQHQPQPQQYLLAVFALFSFFNNPFTSSSSPSHAAHHHTGMVLTPPLAYAPDIVSQFPSATPVPSVGWGWREYIQVFHIVVSVLVLGSLLTSWIGITWNKSDVKKRVRSASVSRSSEKKNEKVDWVKVAEETVLHGDASKLSIYTRYQIYRAITSTRNATINELSTLAMVLQGAGGVVSGIARAKARSIWDAAGAYAEHTKPGSHSKAKISEKLVLAELDVAGAIDRLTTSSVDVKGDDERVYSPLEVLACSLVRERMKEHLGGLFIETVNPTREDGEEKNNDDEIRRTIDAAKELGGTVSELGRILERVWRTPSSVTSEDLALKGCDEEVRALLTALVLYKRVFADAPEESALLSPPPSPKGKEEGGMVFELRRALGSRVFEDAMGGGTLEDARDKVVDLVVEFERRGRALTP
ncbi:hypothetical protein BDQ12DRAFT_645918 [Crucibulum laeve]|uniref:BHLH domain-containing protein n=1 Tax=Crucibulum laeve TaxID=68775 RepID=A0A5C3M7U8_9AGAR|nr:hypothetical protein BDQ12DRAFT_645918 [Crucibulum laeve]